jgi:Haemolysin expression modulating protein
MMGTQDYLLKFRQCHCSDSVERLCDKYDQELDGPSQIEMHRAADHRRAELAVKQNFNIGSIPRSVWTYVK